MRALAAAILFAACSAQVAIVAPHELAGASVAASGGGVDEPGAGGTGGASVASADASSGQGGGSVQDAGTEGGPAPLACDEGAVYCTGACCIPGDGGNGDEGGWYQCAVDYDLGVCCAPPSVCLAP